MPNSRYPIYGLAHRVDVIRFADADDGAGGIVPKGSEAVVYAGRKCRLTMLDPEEEIKDFGQAGGKHWRVLMEYSPNVREADFLRVPWGTPATNGEGDGQPISGKIMTPNDDIVELVSDGATVPTYSDGGDYSLAHAGSTWTLTYTPVGAVLALSGDADDNPFALPGWPAAGDSGGYWYVQGSTAWAALDFRVVWVKDQIDEGGAWHHTSIVMELEDADDEE